MARASKAKRSASQRRPAPRRRPAKKAAAKATRMSPAVEVAAAEEDTLREGAKLLLSEENAIESLASGADPGKLEDYFGPNQYQELRVLAREAASRAVRGGDRVWILPGIMGSHIGLDRTFIDDVVWLDPFDILFGKILKLKMGAERLQALGPILLVYLKLKLKLMIAGFDAKFFAYDWRQSIDELGAQFAQKLAEKPGHVVAHSMGGLVTRAAMKTAARHIRRVVMLGTPNFGSFAPIEAFRGTNGTVRKVAAAGGYKLEDLAGMFAGFNGLIQMLPSAPGLDYFDLSSWPVGGVKPSAASLANARNVMKALPQDFTNPGPEQEIILVAGINRDTKVSAVKKDGEFVYTSTFEGDGTVPLTFAQLPTLARTYFVEEEHGRLPGNRSVLEALPSILATGRIPADKITLSETQPSSRGMTQRTVSETQLLAVPVSLSTRSRPTARDMRELTREFAAPDDTPSPSAPIDLSGGPAAPVAAAAASQFDFSDHLVIGRERQHRLEVHVVNGDLTEIDSGCYVLGLFNHVRPGGAALKLDELMGGAVSQLAGRRMLSTGVGNVTILPKGRHPLRASNLAFVGLGGFEDFGDATYELLGENLMRTFVATRVDDFAMVPFGGSSQSFTATALKNLMVGFLRGLREADPDRRFRTITLCEQNRARFEAIARQLHSLCSTQTFDDVEVVLRFRTLPSTAPPPAAAPARTGAAPRRDCSYLIVRHETAPDNSPGYTATALTPGSQAAIVKAQQPYDANAQRTLLAQLDGLQPANMDAYGTKLTELVLHPMVLTALQDHADRPLIIVHDAGSSRIPWELLKIGQTFPALTGGLSHRFEADSLAIAKWQTPRPVGDSLNVLLITNPTEDLGGAEDEGDRIEELLSKQVINVKLEHLKRGEARRTVLLDHFRSGRYDVVHYAGHAFFDPENPSSSGILCAGHEVLSGADLAGISHLPSLMFFNACEVGRVRQAKIPAVQKFKTGGAQNFKTPARVLQNHLRVRGTVGFAEALLRGGVKNFIGTYWPVGDASALAFAETFYKALIQGKPIADALRDGRQKLYGGGQRDWADYIHYGDTEFVLRQGAA